MSSPVVTSLRLRDRERFGDTNKGQHSTARLRRPEPEAFWGPEALQKGTERGRDWQRSSVPGLAHGPALGVGAAHPLRAPSPKKSLPSPHRHPQARPRPPCGFPAPFGAVLRSGCSGWDFKNASTSGMFLAPGPSPAPALVNERGREGAGASPGPPSPAATLPAPPSPIASLLPAAPRVPSSLSFHLLCCPPSLPSPAGVCGAPPGAPRGSLCQRLHFPPPPPPPSTNPTESTGHQSGVLTPRKASRSEPGGPHVSPPQPCAAPRPQQPPRCNVAPRRAERPQAAQPRAGPWVPPGTWQGWEQPPQGTAASPAGCNYPPHVLPGSSPMR